MVPQRYTTDHWTRPGAPEPIWNRRRKDRAGGRIREEEGGEGEEEEASMTVGEGLAMSTRLSKEHRITREKGS